MPIKEKHFCPKCGRTLAEDKFYKSRNLEKYPTGRLTECKDCLTRHVDNWDSRTFLWILQEADVPYVPAEWNQLLAKYGKDPRKVTGVTILGRYLAKMNLNQYKNWRWADTEYIQQITNNKIIETMRAQDATQQEIDAELQKRKLDIPEGDLREAAGIPDDGEIAPAILEKPAEFQDTISLVAPEPEEDFGLTEDDIKYLRTKWGPAYKQSEWIQMERLWNDMMDSYDIQTAGHLDTLKKLCKTSLKMDQLIDMSDVEGFQKMSKAYNDLMKSGNFQAIQNKEREEDGIDSVSEIVALAESYGYIPRFYVDGPQDKVDRVLQDMQSYTKNLVDSEGALSDMLEQAINQIIKDKENEASTDTETDDLEAELFGDDGGEHLLTDKDFSDFRDFEDRLREEDDKYMDTLVRGDAA